MDIQSFDPEAPFSFDVLHFDLDEREDLINKHKNELKYICQEVDNYLKDVNHILTNRLPLSMISNLTYNLVHNLVYCRVGLAVYDYLQTAYLIDEDYDTNYELWDIFSQCAKKIEKTISNLTNENIFNIDEPSLCENLQPSANAEKRVPISLLNLQHMLSKINGGSLFIALLDNIRGIEAQLKRIKSGINNLTDDDFKSIYNANYALYVETYWPIDGKNFRHHIEYNYLRGGDIKVDTLLRLLRDEKQEFERNKTGVLWRDYFHDKKVLYFEMRRAKVDEEQWKYFFKKICRFEEYDKWIYELEHPQLKQVDYPDSEWDKVFKDNINVKMVKQVLPSLLPKEPSRTDWFVCHKVLEEIEWFHDNSDTHFILWVKDVYGWAFSTENFKSVNGGLKKVCSLDWGARTMTSSTISLSYKTLADKIRNEFVTMDERVVKEDNKRYLKRHDSYIEHKKKL